MRQSRTYLGTSLNPQQYYRECSDVYNNPHAAGIRYVLDRHLRWLEGSVLDMGCGSGLASLIMWTWGSRNGITGVDSEPRMIKRYERETEHKGVVANFWDPLPQAQSAVFSYSLHLCPESRAAMVGFRLLEAGVNRVIVVSPLKQRAESWAGYSCVEETADCVGPDGKTIHGRVYAKSQA